ncbi:MAG TPA: sigma-70 family RNA polymerase sigma factor [Flavobacteriales bacterium]|nr:sigma-70 family RNA polymerase sigma factor [Flavobacteriales bacterium]
MQEHEAITAVRSGDQRAFGWLVKQYQHMVFTVCSRVLRNDAEAEEAAQDSFIKAYQHIDSYQGSAKFSTWLYSIAYRTAISKLRSRPGATLDLEDAHEHAADAEEGTIDAHDRKLALEQALAQLSREDSTIISLFYLGEQSVDEIVTTTGLSASNVKVKLHRSRKKLQEILQNQFKEETWALR